MAKYDLKFELDHLMSYKAALTPPEIIGPVPEGLRFNVHSTGGEVTGPNIQGEILPGGGDSLILRTDGVLVLNVRTTIKSNDGALIFCYYTGTADLGENAYNSFLKGESGAQEIAVRSNPWFSTAHPKYVWMNRLFCLGIGKITTSESKAEYDLYAVR